jgi:hypothetical protein
MMACYRSMRGLVGGQFLLLGGLIAAALPGGGSGLGTGTCGGKPGSHAPVRAWRSVHGTQGG